HKGSGTSPGRVFQRVPTFSLSNVCPNSEAVFYPPATNLSVNEADALHSRIARTFKISNEYVLSDTDEGRDVSCNRSDCIRLRLGTSCDAPDFSRGNPGHAYGILRRLSGDGHRVFRVARYSFFT